MPDRPNDPTTIVQSRHSGHRFASIFRVCDMLRLLRALPINAQRIDSEFSRGAIVARRCRSIAFPAIVAK